MKLKDIASKAITIIKERGTEGVNNAELAEIINTPKRRVYDVIAILRAANLITTERSGAGTRIYWNQEQPEEKHKKINNDLQSFVASRIKVSTKGNIYNVANRGSTVVIDLDDAAEMSIEPIYD
jgi:predicted transcriptional regulator